MPDYRRYRIPGGTYFFTVNLLERRPNNLLIRHFETFRQAVKETRKRWSFHIDAWVVLPDHMHSTAWMQEVGQRMEQLPSVWTLPDGDTDNSNRWRVIKQTFSKALPVTERRSSVRVSRGERGIWQSFRVLLTPLTYFHVGNADSGSI